MKKDKDIKKLIIDLFSEDTYYINEVCDRVGIARATYYKWLDDDEEFAKQVQEAQTKYLRERVRDAAKRSLIRKIEGYATDETTIVHVPSKKEKDKDGKPKSIVKEKKTVHKNVPPDTAAIIFALTNVDPEGWKNRQDTKVDAHVTEGEYDFSDIPEDMLEQLADKLQEAQAKRERKRRGL